MLSWIMANWQTVAVAVMAIGEVVSLFVPGASGTVAGIVKALTGLGVKDPSVGK